MSTTSMVRRVRTSPTSWLSAALSLMLAGPLMAQVVPKGPTTAASTGTFGPVVAWPLIPIHAAVLPDGRVLSYGTDAVGNQGAQFNYDVWDPRQGTAQAAHMVLPNATGTDIFCSAQSLLPTNGLLMLAGGDKTVNGVRNYSNAEVNAFDFTSNTMFAVPQARMGALRWYPSLLTLNTGETLVMGGRADPLTPSPTPEVFSLTTGWRPLVGATNQEAYGAANVTYPRAWQAPTGKVFILSVTGSTFYLDTAGTGNIAKSALTLPEGHPYLPSVMYAPGKILALRKLDKAYNIDISGMVPTATVVTGVGQDRYDGSATVMADGKVFVSGGSFADNVANGVAFTAKIWDPATKAWTLAATAKQMRLYHSISMMLPDGTVLTGGGGAPGPQTNLNAENYYPPYLYKRDGSGLPAARPVITQAPVFLGWNTVFSLTANAPISRVTLVRAGSVTHTVDFDQRFIDLKITGAGNTRTVTSPANANIAPPGFYMMFAFDAAGTPSVASMVRIN